jgi:hypothetical protein
MILMYRCFGLERLLDEIVLSYSLLFSQSNKGRRTLKQIAKKPVNEVTHLERFTRDGRVSDRFLGTIRSYYLGHTADRIVVFNWKSLNQSLKYFRYPNSAPSLEDFSIFRERLLELKRKMDNYKTRSVGDLLKPGYGDRFTWYKQMFFLTIGMIGLFFSIVQTACAIKSYNESVKLTLQGLDVAVKSLNVSLQALELQKLQMNITT